MYLTLEERERAAYISGDTALAEALGAAADTAQENEALQWEVEKLESRILDLQWEVEKLESRIFDLQEQIELLSSE